MYKLLLAHVISLSYLLDHPQTAHSRTELILPSQEMAYPRKEYKYWIEN